MTAKGSPWQNWYHSYGIYKERNLVQTKLNKLGTAGTYLNGRNATYNKPTANIKLNEEKVDLQQDKDVHYDRLYSAQGCDFF